MDRSDRQVLSKTTLGAICYAIEQMAMAAPHDATVVACFQRSAFFTPRARWFSRLAQQCRTVVVAFEGTLLAPAPLHHARLEAGSALRDEWSLIVLAPTISATLVAIDRHALVPYETTVDRSRSFDSHWSVGRHSAADELERVTLHLSPHLPKSVVDSLHAATQTARAQPVELAERAFGGAFAVFVERLERAYRDRAELGVRLDASRHECEHDALTGLGNRRFLQQWLSVPSAELEIPPIGLVMIDLDRFKAVNDTFGHDIGDALLVAVAGTIREQLRPIDVAVRLGGDEFLVCCPNVNELELRRIADRLVASIAEIRIGGARAAASAGVAITRRLPAPLHELDAAMYAAKRRGGGVSTVSA